MTSKLLPLVLATFALAACGGDDGGGGAGPVGVFPVSSFTGKTVEVLVYGGPDTSWSEGVSVDFGEGMTVDSVEVVSETALVATVTISPSAAEGAKDVTVDGDTLAGTFTVNTPISVQTYGTAAQGSILLLEVTNLDAERPFDTTSTGDGLFTAIEYTNFAAVTEVPGATLNVEEVQPMTAFLVLFLDVDVAPGAVPVIIENGAPGASTTMAQYDVLDVAARTAEALTPGNQVTGSQSMDSASRLFSVSATDLNLTFADVVPSSDMTGARLAVLGSSGSFADLLSFGDQIELPIDGDFYVVFFDLSGATGYDYTIDVASEAMTETAEGTDPGDTSGEAIAVMGPTYVTAAFDVATDEDWYSITVAQDDILRVYTEPGSPMADPLIELYAAGDLGTPVAASDDFGLHEDFTSDELDAGDYFVRILWSPEFVADYSAAESMYNAVFYIR